MITLSYSKVKTWRTCRRLYRFLYVERLPTPPRPALFVGEVVHRTLQAYLSYPPLERLRLDLGQLLRQLWRAAGTQRRRLTFGTAEEEARRGRQALAMLERFYRSRHAAAQPAALERWLEVPLAAEVVVNGRADRIDEESGVLQVVDYKTGWVPRGEEPNITLQAAFYTFLASAATGRPVGGVTFFYLKDGSERIVRVAPEETSALTRDLVAVATEMAEETRFPPQPGPACRWCDFLDRCPEGAAWVTALRSGGGELRGELA